MTSHLLLRTAVALGVLACGLRAADGPESATVRGESTTVRKRLAEAEQKLLAGKAGDAIDDLQRILDEAGDTLVTADGRQFVAARRYIHQFLAKLPDSELKKYRDRVEEPAAKLLARGQTTRDARPLLELLDAYAVSRPAEDAMLLLAELAFERGDFATAERHWRSLLPEAEYPAARTPAAILRARIVLATLYRGDRLAAEKLGREFAKSHPNAEGRLAGKSGRLAELVANALSAGSPAPPAEANAEEWPTLGGSPSRSGRVPGGLPRDWPSQPTWTATIPPSPDAANGRPPPVSVVKSLAFHPIVSGGRAYLADAGRVIAFDLQTGKPEIVFDTRRPIQPDAGNVGHTPLMPNELQLPSRYDADFTLSAADGKLYARFGHPELFPTPRGGAGPLTRPSVLARLDPPTHLAWQQYPPAAADVAASWEGAPLGLEGRVLAAFVRSEGGRTVHAIACYRDGGDRPLWVTDVCESAAVGNRPRHELLTLAGRNVVFCSQSGVIVAIDARTGRHAWAFRYPRVRQLAADGRHRDLSPPVAADGRVFVAPNDADHLYAFDAESGRLLWEDGPLVFDHLLGTAAGKVIAVIAGPQRGLRAYDAATGSSDPPLGWRNHDDPTLATVGRGLLSDDFVLWPTEKRLYTIRVADGTVAAQPARVPPGNLVFAGNVLLVATPTELLGYVREGGDTPEPSPGRPLLGKIPIKTRTEVVRAEPRPTLRLPATLEPLASSAEGMNVGDAGDSWLVRSVRGSTEFVSPTGQVVRYTGGPPTAAMPCDGRMLLQFPDGVLLVDPATGRDVWTLPQPRVTAVVPICGGVVVQVGEQHLLACESTTGRPCWVLDSQGRPRPPGPGVESGPRFLAVAPFANKLLVQVSTGRRWLVDAATGKLLHDAPSADRPWVAPPAAVDERLAVADGAARVSLIDAGGRTVWQRNFGREASLTGDAVQLRAFGDSVFAFVRRNHGTDFERLSATAGVSRWTDRPGFIAADVEAIATAADDETLFVPTDHRLVALKLDTGREAWAAELSHAAAWRAIALRDRVLVLPAAAIAAEANPVVESFVRFPHPRRLLGLFGTWLDDAGRGMVPVLLFDARTGRLQQRFTLAAAGRVSVTPTADGVRIAAGGAFYKLQ